MLNITGLGVLHMKEKGLINQDPSRHPRHGEHRALSFVDVWSILEATCYTQGAKDVSTDVASRKQTWNQTGHHKDSRATKL